jgi:hemoglobin
MPTLYEQIGGQPTISKLINAFYKKVFTDPLLGPFFTHASLEKLTKMQEGFFSIALDGPPPENEISLVDAHQGRRISREHLTRFTDHLLTTLKDVGVDDQHAMDIVARIATYSDDILGDVSVDG